MLDFVATVRLFKNAQFVRGVHLGVLGGEQRAWLRSRRMKFVWELSQAFQVVTGDVERWDPPNGRRRLQVSIHGAFRSCSDYMGLFGIAH